MEVGSSLPMRGVRMDFVHDTYGGKLSCIESSIYAFVQVCDICYMSRGAHRFEEAK